MITSKRIEEIKKHFRLYAPKNIHKEISELLKYIKSLEDQIESLEQKVQGSLFDKLETR